MSTRSSICVKDGDKYKTVYCHFDGYHSGVGKTLIENYNSFEKAISIVDLGDLSFLEKSVDCPDGHSYDTPCKGCTVFYGRDRGEEGVSAIVCESYEDALRQNRQEYNYLFDNNQWYCDGKELTIDMCKD